MTFQPFQIFGADRPSRWVITVDHASNLVPKAVNGGDLGVAPEDMQRHIAYDIGAAATALELGTLLNAPVVFSNFSRLVIDPNRGEQDPTLIMRLYDGTIIPTNADIDTKEEQRRIETYYRPYHDAITGLLATRTNAAALSVHSFAPQLKGRPARPWEVGILHADGLDRRNLGPAVVKHLRDSGDITVGENEPYPGHLPGDAMDRHCLQFDRPNCLIELRQDLIAEHAGQVQWAKRLAPALDHILTSSGF